MSFISPPVDCIVLIFCEMFLVYNVVVVCHQLKNRRKFLLPTIFNFIDYHSFVQQMRIGILAFFKLLLPQERSNIFQRTHHFLQVAVGNMQISQRCFDIIMTQQFLNHHYINAFV